MNTSIESLLTRRTKTENIIQFGKDINKLQIKNKKKKAKQWRHLEMMTYKVIINLNMLSLFVKN